MVRKGFEFNNPLTAGVVHISFLHLFIALYISAFEPVKDKN